METPRQVSPVTLWDEFSGGVDDAVFDCNAAAHTTVWQMEVGFDHLRVFSMGDPALAVDVEFFPDLLRVIALFSPSGTMRVYDFGGGRDLTSDLGPDAVPASPQPLGRYLLKLIPNPEP